MISERQRGVFAIHYLLQAVLGGALFFIWYHAVKTVFTRNLTGGISHYKTYLLVILTAGIVSALYNNKKREVLIYGRAPQKIRYSLNKVVIIALGLLIYISALQDTSISRLFLFGLIPLLILAVVATDLFFPNWISDTFYKNSKKEKVILVLLNHQGLQNEILINNQSKIIQWIDEQSRFGIEVKGFIGSRDDQKHFSKYEYLGGEENASDIIASQKPSSVIVLNSPTNNQHLLDLINICEQNAARISLIHDWEQHFGRSVMELSINGLKILQFRAEPLQNPLSRIMKRGFDIIFSLLVLFLILPPLSLIVWLFQRAQSPGPLFFKQIRDGRNGTRFFVSKYRTMETNNLYLDRQATADDDRVYPFGKILRKYSLDEIPQFLNVLKGEMSIVGPRPHMPEHNEQWEQFTHGYHIRSFVKPGITGLAQTRGLRGEVVDDESIRQRVECDIEYIENWSILLDIGLVLKTILIVIFPHKNAY